MSVLNDIAETLAFNDGGHPICLALHFGPFRHKGQ